MSKYNHRVLFDIPPIQALEALKDHVLTPLTAIEGSLLTVVRAIDQELKSSPLFQTFFIATSLLLVIGLFLGYLGKRKHAFYRPTRKETGEVGTSVNALKGSIDALRKHILDYTSNSQENGNIGAADRSPVAANQKTLEDIQKLLQVYNKCVKTNNSFNEYFLDEFKLIFLELKELKKSKVGLRGSSKKKEVVTKRNTPTEEKQDVTPLRFQKPVPVKTPIIPPTLEPLKSEDFEILKEEVNLQHTSAGSGNPFDNPSDIHSSFDQNPAQHPQLTSQNYPDASTAPASSTGQSLSPTKKTLEPSEPSQIQGLGEQIPDDPIISMPPPSQHRLPTLPPKLKTRDISGASGRRPPPPIRR